ncbi:hypothetical protein E2320_006647, partial [Naja naja]
MIFWAVLMILCRAFFIRSRAAVCQNALHGAAVQSVKQSLVQGQPPPVPICSRCRSWLSKGRKEDQDTFSNAYFERKTRAPKKKKKNPPICVLIKKAC